MPKLLHQPRGLAFKGLLALAAAALPALLTAFLLTAMLVTTVTESERDVEHAIGTAELLTNIRVEIEREHSFVTRIPTQLDLVRVQQLAKNASDAGDWVDAAISELAVNARIVSPDAVRELRSLRQAMNKMAGEIG